MSGIVSPHQLRLDRSTGAKPIITSVGPMRSNIFACEQSGAFKIGRLDVDSGGDWER
jgi:hypothetical protein